MSWDKNRLAREQEAHATRTQGKGRAFTRSFSPADISREERRNSIHGHETGLLHTVCGGEVYYDWAVTYIYEGETVPSLRCTVCKREMVGDNDLVLNEHAL